MKITFKDGSHAKKCETVQELINALSELPRDLEIHQGFEDSVDVVIFRNTSDEYHVSFEEGGDWSDDE